MFSAVSNWYQVSDPATFLPCHFALRLVLVLVLVLVLDFRYRHRLALCFH